jgi:hypothetical protein
VAANTVLVDDGLNLGDVLRGDVRHGRFNRLRRGRGEQQRRLKQSGEHAQRADPAGHRHGHNRELRSVLSTRGSNPMSTFFAASDTSDILLPFGEFSAL